MIGGITFPGQSVGPEWTVEYSTCTPSTPNGTLGSTFNATVNALTGTVISSHTTATVVCSGSSSSSGTPLGSALSLVAVSGFSSGATNLYNLTVTSAGNGVIWQDTTPEITGPSGTPIGPGIVWNLTVADLSGTPIAIFTSTGATWSASPNLLISAGQGASVRSNYPLTTDYLVLQGSGAFTGSVTSSV